MKIFDAHNHIQDQRLAASIDPIMKRATEASVVAMAVKGCHEGDWQRVAHLSATYPNVFPSFGIHPWFIADRTENWLTELQTWLENHPNAAVGEIGIDHAISPRADADQEHVFLQQLELARELQRPATIHCRKAWGRLITLLDQFGTLPEGLLIHCFGGSAEVATELVKRGAYISFSGSITRPNAKKAAAALRAVPSNRILIETDAPDLLPTPAEGPLNEPANIRFTLQEAAKHRTVDPSELAALTFENAMHFYTRFIKAPKRAQ